jgi:hypothetical protein
MAGMRLNASPLRALKSPRHSTTYSPFLFSDVYGPIWGIRVYVVGLRPHRDLFESCLRLLQHRNNQGQYHTMPSLLERYSDC